VSAFVWRRGDWSPGTESPPRAVPGGEVIHLIADGESPANTLSRAGIDDLERALAAIAAEPGVKALVLSSAKTGHFVAGADIDEIGAIADAAEATRLAARAQEVFGRLERLPFPSFALIHGTCLGGGLELALACHYRIAVDAPSTRIGLPEVNLGIVPGFGGSQRLPRLIGPAKALPLILSGSRLPAAVALRRGVVDAVVPPEGAMQVALRLVGQVLVDGGERVRRERRRRRGGWRSALMEANPFGRALIARAARRRVIARTGGHYPAPLAAIELAIAAASRPLAAGLAAEARVVGELAVGPVCKNLVRIFQASERARKLVGPEEGESGRWPAPGNLGILGAGVMGAGVASAALERGLAVRLRDIAEAPLARGLAQVAGDVRRLVAERRRTALEAEEILSRLTHTTRAEGFRRADAVLEAVVERLDVKRKVLREIEPELRDDCLFLTNTSALGVGEIQSAAERPERVVGLHFFNPVAKMPLVEVIAGRSTAPWAVSRAIGLAQALGKYPVVVQDSPGFLVNRLLMPYIDAAVRLLESGVPGPAIDAAARRFGMPMGPLRLVDEVGVEIAVEVAETLSAAFGARATPSELLERFVERGWLGRKSGCGFYRHAEGRAESRWNEELAALLPASARKIGEREITEALIDPMVDEAARCLEEEIVADAETIDLALVMGTGFPPFRGGLLRHADSEGVAAIAGRIAERGGARTPCSLLAALAGERGTFYGSPPRSHHPVR